MIRLVPLDQVPSQPWRNGGGSTQELLTWPAADDWLLRISVAQIEQNGPFSAYPGIDRWFAVVRGNGVALRFAGRTSELTQGSAPLRFDGAAAPDCNLLNGSTQDLNLMVRDDRGRGGMTRVTVGETWHSTVRLRSVFTSEPATLHVDGRHDVVLPPDTLAWSDDAAGQRWRLTSAGAPTRAWWIKVQPREAVE